MMIVVCDNTDIAELVYHKISGETQVELVTQADIEDEEEEEEGCRPREEEGQDKMDTSYGQSEVRPDFANTATESTRSASTRSCSPRPKAAIPRRARKTLPRNCGRSSPRSARSVSRASTCVALSQSAC